MSSGTHSKSAMAIAISYSFLKVLLKRFLVVFTVTLIILWCLEVDWRTPPDFKIERKGKIQSPPISATTGDAAELRDSATGRKRILAGGYQPPPVGFGFSSDFKLRQQVLNLPHVGDTSSEEDALYEKEITATARDTCDQLCAKWSGIEQINQFFGLNEMQATVHNRSEKQRQVGDYGRECKLLEWACGIPSCRAGVDVIVWWTHGRGSPGSDVREAMMRRDSNLRYLSGLVKAASMGLGHGFEPVSATGSTAGEISGDVDLGMLRYLLRTLEQYGRGMGTAYYNHWAWTW